MTLLMDNMCIVNITAELCILPKKSQRRNCPHYYSSRTLKLSYYLEEKKSVGYICKCSLLPVSLKCLWYFVCVLVEQCAKKNQCRHFTYGETCLKIILAGFLVSDIFLVDAFSVGYYSPGQPWKIKFSYYLSLQMSQKARKNQ